MLTDEYVFSIDKINKPKKLESYDAIYSYLVRLFLLNPGTYQSNPDMGIGLVKNYRYGDEFSLEDLKYQAAEQIRTYLPGFETINVDVSMENKTLHIQILLDGVAYEINFDTELGSLLSLT